MADKANTTPKGTAPLPTKRRTKHKRPEYGLQLQNKAKERRMRREPAVGE